MLSELEEQQRVQIVVSGRRFELTVAIVSMYTSLFRRFFHEAFAALHRGECSASVWQSLYNTTREELQQEKQYKQNSETDRIDSTIHTNGNSSSSNNSNNNIGMDLIVPVTAIEREERDGNVLWRFVYTSTLLAPEDVGVIFVYIRKLFQWSRKGATSPQPQLPIRWNELMYDGQLSVARVVCTFGVEPLIGHYDHPTAAAAAEKEMNKDKRTNGSEDITECVLSAREKAEVYLRRQQEEEEIQEGIGVVHPSVEDDDLLLATTACSRCGITGHTDAECVR
ncbi:hypothetical protein LSM04_000198 [Trypanosoma melophagium]|uniref:uncharacterized protein n=1 Tax=Trypanosoma melophagium TaxID=715481 RepID=UPI00351A3B7E|nr:hypothetical protein LSM04_000198 [Trypanosoma melophagium]